MSEVASAEEPKRQERRRLQARLQQLKKSGDKKQLREVQQELATLELAMRNATVQDEEPSSHDQPQEQQQRVSKAQKRRDKKAAEEQERDKRIAEQELANRNGPRNLELKTIRQILQQKGLAIHTIRSDGDCLYGAVAHQLVTTGRAALSVADLRKTTADRIRSHKDNFVPFICNPNTGDMLTDEEFEKYCCDIADTKTWGGQVELQALSSALTCPIHVVQSESPTLIVQGEEYSKLGEPLVLTYHRHMFGLGEHYNSTEKFNESEKSEENPD